MLRISLYERLSASLTHIMNLMKKLRLDTDRSDWWSTWAQKQAECSHDKSPYTFLPLLLLVGIPSFHVRSMRIEIHLEYEVSLSEVYVIL